MTIVRRDGQGTPFGDWLRAQPGLDSNEFQLSVTDTDFWSHRFSVKDGHRPVARRIDHIMMVEIKTFHRDLDFAQRDTLSVIDQLLRRGTIQNGRRRPIKIPETRPGRPGCFRQVRCFGVHTLVMSGSRPDESDTVIWDGKFEVSEVELVEILRFDRDPDAPKRYLDTRRHHRPPLRERHPSMFAVEGEAA